MHGSITAIVGTAIALSLTGGTPNAGVKVLINGVSAGTFTTDANGNLAGITVAWASIPSGSQSGAAFVNCTQWGLSSPAAGIILSCGGENASSKTIVKLVYS